MVDYFPCLEARILGGAFVHECWGSDTGGRLTALCESKWHAESYAKELAGNEPVDSTRFWAVTDSRGEQSFWTRKRVDAERAKAGAA